MKTVLKIAISLLCATLTFACTVRDEPEPDVIAASETSRASPRVAVSDRMAIPIQRPNYTEGRAPCDDINPLRHPLFGDLHVHTSLSFDAVAGRIDTRPQDAYDFARGKAIPFFPQGEDGKPTATVQIDRPLDFLAVTDHSELLGERALCTVADSPAYDGAFCTRYREVEFYGTLMMASVIDRGRPERIESLCGADGALCREYAKAPWQEIITAAEEAYDRTEHCEFTSFIGYEYTGTPGTSNYHRNVIFRNSDVPKLPVSFVEAPKDYQLWRALDELCGLNNNCDYMTIPHNSNMSNGKLLTPYADLEQSDENRRDYARLRLNREPLMEIFQHKGGSECTNGLQSVLGAADELCDVEQVRTFGEVSSARRFHLEGTEVVFSAALDIETAECAEGEKGSRGMFGGGCISRNDFLRTALLTGMEQEQDIGLNPVKLGVIASTDGHTGTPGNVLENRWTGTVSGEMTVHGRLKAGTLPTGIKGNPGGLAGVWSVENSRDAIFEALERRETFGTSGPRIAPRFFAGWDFPDSSCEQADMLEQAYASGVSMGGDMLPALSPAARPRFILAANRDPLTGSAPLQQLQLIKGWVAASGERHTQVIPVAGSPGNGASVDLSTGERSGNGYDNLCVVFEDKTFDPALATYYYMRVVENPSPRWSLLDCLSLDLDERPESCADLSQHVIQEMAWTSPIWYTPTKTDVGRL